MNAKRVHFYPVNDLACFPNMELAENVLRNFSEDKIYDINDIIELYHIKLYIDNKIYLKNRTEYDIKQVKEKVSKIWTVIIRYWHGINSENILRLFKSLESWTFQETFWQLSANLSIYKNVNKKTFSKLLYLENIDVQAILHQNKIVNYYDNELKSFLLSYNKSAELILSQFVEMHDRIRKEMYFPTSLNIFDREEIVLRYLNGKEVNLNFVRLVLNCKNDKGKLVISDKTKLKAKRLEKKLNNEIFDENSGVYFGIKIVFDKLQSEPLKILREGCLEVFSYSEEYLTANGHPLYLISHFSKLFYYLDNQRCISMVSKSSDFGTIEKLLMRSINEYPVGPVFKRKDILSLYQIVLVDRVLEKSGKFNVELILKYFFCEFLEQRYSLKGIRFNLPSVGASYFEKIRMLLAEFDALLKQYEMIKEDGEIDAELFCLSSKPIGISQIPSFAAKKYCYPVGNKLSMINHFLFSDQSDLTYVEPFKKSNYHCLYDLIQKEKVLYRNFGKHQLRELNLFLDLGYLYVDHSGYLRIKNENKLFLLRQLFKEGVLSYWHYSKDCRKIIDEMVKEKTLYFESTLFNKLESRYLNYFLNKKEFTNGLDLRNSFMHGTNPDSEDELMELYYILLRIMILTALKMDDDQVLKNKSKSNHSTV